MSVRVCTDEHFTSTSVLTAFALGVLPRLVTEQRAVSAHDGDIQQLADPLVMMDSTLRWRNDSGLDQQALVEVTMAPRSVVTSNPNAIAIRDDYGVAIGTAPDQPSTQSSLGEMLVRYRINDFRAPSMAFQTGFDDRPGGSVPLCVGVVPPGHELVFRYVCSVSTPGHWRTPDTPRMNVRVNYTALALYTSLPAGGFRG